MPEAAESQNVEIHLVGLPPVPSDYLSRMPRQKESKELVRVGLDTQGRDAFLTAGTADAWRRLYDAARTAGFELQLVSAFRSIARQEEILLRKLKCGIPLENILKVCAYPGFSEHHTGRAIDVCTRGHPLLEETFALTMEFKWLQANAPTFGFHQTYTEGNALGLVHEPWHWCWHASESTP